MICPLSIIISICQEKIILSFLANSSFKFYSFFAPKVQSIVSFYNTFYCLIFRKRLHRPFLMQSESFPPYYSYIAW